MRKDKSIALIQLHHLFVGNGISAASDDDRIAGGYLLIGSRERSQGSIDRSGSSIATIGSHIDHLCLQTCKGHQGEQE